MAMLHNTDNYFHNEYVYHTISMHAEIERQKFGGLNRWFIFPVHYSPGASYTKSEQILTVLDMHMHHPTKGHKSDSMIKV
jgi:hypothetical protein